MASNNREARVTFNAETSSFRQNVSSANQTLKEIQASLKLNAAEMANASDKTEAYQQRQELLSNEMQTQQTKIDNLNAQLEVASRLYGEGSNEVSRLTVQITQATTAHQRMQNDLDNVNNALADLAQQSAHAESAVGRLEQTISSQESDLNSLRQAYANVVLEQGSASQEAQQLESEITQLNGELQDNRQRLQSARTAANDFGESLEDSSQSAEESADGYTAVADVVSDLATEVIGNAIEAFQELGVEADKALNKLEGATGSSTAQMKEYEQTMNNIYSSGFGESMEEVSDSISVVVQQMGKLDAGEIENITKNAFTLSDTFDMDVNESVRAVNSMMNQFGIDSESAFNLIVQGAQNGLNANDDLLDVVNEYSVQFADAGYSADDMFNMLANGAETGTWSVDKLGDAVKEMNIRFSDGTVADALNENSKALGLSKDEVVKLQTEYNKGGDSAQTAVGKMIDSILSVKDETEQYKIGVSVFGTMWEDLGADAIGSLMSTQGAITSTKASVQDLGNTVYDDLGSKFTELKRNIQVNIVQPIVDVVTPALKTAFDVINDNWSTLAPIFVALGSAMGALAVVVGASFAKQIGLATAKMIGLNVAMLANPVTWIIVGITAVVAAFIYLWNTSDSFKQFWIDLWEKIKQVFQPVVDVLKSSMSDAFDKIQPLWEQLKTSFDQIKTSLEPLQSLFLVIAGILGGVIATVIGVVVGLISGLVGSLSGLITMITGAIGVISGVMSAVFTTIGAIWETIVALFTGNTDKISDIWSDWGSKMKEIVSGIWDSIKTYFTGGIDAVKGFVSGFIDGIVGFFQGLFDTLVGHSIIPDLIKKLKEWFMWLPNKISGIVKDFVKVVVEKFTEIKEKVTSIFNTVKSFLSKVWNDIKTTVVNAATNVYNNVKEKFNNVKTTISSAINSAKSTVTSVFDSIKSKVSSVVSGVYSSVKEKFDSVKSTISSSLNSAKSTVTSVFDGIKSKITSTINSAKDVVKSGIDKIKSFFNFTPKLPSVKLPHFKVTGSKNPIDWIDKGVPSFSVSWYKKGAIFTKPTIFNTNNGFSGVGEAGAEAVLPIERLQGFIDEALAKQDNSDLIDAINNLANRNIELSMNGMNVATAMASETDVVQGNRLLLKERGLSL